MRVPDVVPIVRQSGLIECVCVCVCGTWQVLESFKIMDYSLLVGIHNLDLAAREEAERRRANSTGDDETSGDESAPPTAGTSASAGACSSGGGGGGGLPLVRSRSINRQKLVAHSTALESIQAESEPIDEEDDVP